MRPTDGARRPHDGEELTLGYFEIYLPQNVRKTRLGPVAFFDVSQCDHAACVSRPPSFEFNAGLPIRLLEDNLPL